YLFFIYILFFFLLHIFSFFFFFFNDTPTTDIYTLSLHDALPIYEIRRPSHIGIAIRMCRVCGCQKLFDHAPNRTRVCAHAPHTRSEEHTSELQSRSDLVCRLLLEKKKKKKKKKKLKNINKKKRI